ncbi:hypothetical protein AB0G04_05985 [Actinoplanes sp. NPDC023801]|uniref:hypothetical protein n=1 Tax=Actinoplanes sp. NPDC023801 TaxID=3154595 RepID=UPI0033DCE1D8
MRFALLTALTAALLAGCTDDGKTPAATPASSPAPAPAVSGEQLPEAENPAGNLASVGKEADWDAFVLACDDPEQEAVVQQVTTGDVTGDGVADSLVARTCDGAAPYFPSTVEVFDGSSPAQRPWRIGTPLLKDVAAADKPWVTAVAVRSGEIVVQAHGTAGNGCPKLRITYRYALEGTALKQKARDEVPSGACLPAGT